MHGVGGQREHRAYRDDDHDAGVAVYSGGNRCSQEASTYRAEGAVVTAADRAESIWLQDDDGCHSEPVAMAEMERTDDKDIEGPDYGHAQRVSHHQRSE